MRLKTFHAVSLTEALDQVRDHFGQDAAILSTQEHDSGGFTVTAAIDATEPEPAAPPTAAPVPEPEEDEHDDIADALEHHRIPPGLSQRLLNAAASLGPADKRSVLTKALDELLGFHDISRPGRLTVGQAILLVGPSGAGKTATVAKLCAMAKLRGVPTRIATLDFESAGAQEQIAAFAAVLDTPLDCVAKPKQLAALKQASDDTLLLVDTVGTNPFSQQEILRCAEIVAALGVRPFLVLPAGGDPVESAEMALVFAELGANRLIATRMDASRRLGGVLSAAFAAELALSAGGVSPMVGNGLSSLSARSLADALISRAPTPFPFMPKEEPKPT